MDDNIKQVASYKLDQEILDARGINMTVDEVASLPTCSYTERVRALRLGDDDHAFLKGLRRRIKNRLASQNSRRRSMEHLRRLTRELRAVRACRSDALADRRALLARRERVLQRCLTLRAHLAQILEGTPDLAELPNIDQLRPIPASPEHDEKPDKIDKQEPEVKPTRDKIDRKTVFECCIDKLVQQSVNHMYRPEKNHKKTVFAKTVFLNNVSETDVKSMVVERSEEVGEVLNLCVKEGRRGHGRKQSAPRRIAYAFTEADDVVLDLKIKKEPQ